MTKNINIKSKIIIIIFCFICFKQVCAEKDSTQTKKEKKTLSFRDPDDGAFNVS